ncbi:CU044_2847 family protein [Streptomyces sp. C36]|uniref:CU044_2847 family protein n=1 Tax=Streptomyces sp. C36 TaxID=3237122 RepID=UPI0034C69A34
MEIPVDGAEPVQVEVEAAPGGVVRVTRPGEVVKAAGESLESALGRLRSVAETLASSLRDVAHAPEEMTVEFGVKLNTEAGLVIAKAATEANFTVVMKWTKHPS